MRRAFSRRRSTAILILICLVFGAYLARLYYLQVAKAQGGRQMSVSRTVVSVEPLRGEIRDRNGNLLATNRQVNNVVFDYTAFPSGKEPQKRNEIILSLIRLFSSANAEWKDKLPIRITKSGALKFVKDQEGEITYLKSKAFLHMNPYASVQNCFDALVERYELQDYDPADARNIASVYYSMHKEGFNASTKYVFATDVSTALMTVVKEKSDLLPGVDVRVDAEREYVDGTIAPHILGVVGPISAEEYEAKKDAGYGKNDVIGKNGIEAVYEANLRGTPGEKVIFTDADGSISETYTVMPTQGDTVVLTIDKDLQIAAQDALAALVREQQLSRAYVTAGAVVVMDTRSNEILAAASYPTFDLSTYNEDAAQLLQNKANPLWNRALRSTYTPGSTIKPAVAMAGLEEGVIDKDTQVYCNGVYRHYEDYQPGCTGFHGGQDVVHALYNSCNIYFYETARLLGIEKLNSYFTMFGLGEKTGVELTEAEGNVDSYNYRVSKGDMWTPGLTLQAGIGHGDNMFTPVQLCSYVSTVANRGVRYKAHFVKSVMSADFVQTRYQSETQVLSQANFSDDNWDLVWEGMHLVGTKSYADFSAVPVDVAAKTGTTTVYKRIDGWNVETFNGLIMAFAPYDDPEVCVAVIVEGAGSGGSTAPVASAVLAQYFSEKNSGQSTQDEDTLLQ
ncbi:MAG: hypothetical protein IKN72_10555 [Clostridia bacterium]|nr:hypothetical protein [Clostridia bacterium]